MLFRTVDKSSNKQLKLTTTEAEKYAPVTRDKRLDKISEKLSETLSKELDLKRGDLTDVEFSGNVSDAFTQDKAARMAKGTEEAHQLATLFSRVKAPEELLRREDRSYARVAAKKDTERSNLNALLRLFGAQASGRRDVLDSVSPNDAAMITGEFLNTAGALAAMYPPNTTPELTPASAPYGIFGSTSYSPRR